MNNTYVHPPHCIFKSFKLFVVYTPPVSLILMVLLIFTREYFLFAIKVSQIISISTPTLPTSIKNKHNTRHATQMWQPNSLSLTQLYSLCMSLANLPQSIYTKSSKKNGAWCDLKFPSRCHLLHMNSNLFLNDPLSNAHMVPIYTYSLLDTLVYNLVYEWLMGLQYHIRHVPLGLMGRGNVQHDIMPCCCFFQAAVSMMKYIVYRHLRVRVEVQYIKIYYSF